MCDRELGIADASTEGPAMKGGLAFGRPTYGGFSESDALRTAGDISTSSLEC
jgi:hypothetical protein